MFYIIIPILIIALCIVLLQNTKLRKENTRLKESYLRQQEGEMLFRTIFDQAPIGIAISQDDECSSFANYTWPSINPMFEKITGWTKEELADISWMDITHPEDLDKDLENYTKFKSGEIDRYDMEKRYIKPDGSDVWIHMFIVPLRFHNAKVCTHLCLIQDITKHKEIEMALYDSERSKTVLLDNLPGMAYRCCYDRDWTMLFVSAGCYELTGYNPDSLLYNKDLSFNELIAQEYQDILWREWRRILTLQIPFRYEYEIVSASGERKWVLEMGQGIYDKNGKVEALEGIIIDISEQKKKEAQIRYINNHDYLTGLYNRKYYEEAMAKIDNDKSCPVSVFIVDINGVRLINDAFGYAEGDQLLRETANILQSCCSPNDILSRIGGDEFGILLPNTDKQKANVMFGEIDRVCKSYNESRKNKLYEINLSIGYATKERAEDSIKEAEKIADEYMRNRKLFNIKSSHSYIISSMMATVYEKSQETEEHAKRLTELSL